MKVIAEVQSGVSMRPTAPARPAGADATRSAAEARNAVPSDAVELSPAAQRQLQDAPVRSDLIAQVREQIANGTYLTEDKLNATIDRLAKVLRQP